MSIEKATNNEIVKANADVKPSLDSANDVMKGIWDVEESPVDKSVESANSIAKEIGNSKFLEVGVNDIKRAESIQKMCKEIDLIFNSEDIKNKSDAANIPISKVSEIIVDKPEAEASAAIVYFLANKIALSEYVSDSHFSSFRDSPARVEMVEEVTHVIQKTSWASDLAANAKDNLSALGEQASEVISGAATAVAEVAVEVATTVRDTAVEVATTVRDTAVEVATTVRDEVVEIAEEISDQASELSANASEVAAEVADAAADVIVATAEVLVDAAETTAYLGCKVGVGALRVAENCSDAVQAYVYTAMGEEEQAREVLESSFTDTISAIVDETFDVNDTVRNLGEAAEVVGETAAVVGLTVLAITNIPATATVLGVGAPVAGGVGAGTIIAATAGATAVTALGLNTAGETLRHYEAQTGEVGVREITASVVAGATTIAATVIAGGINSQIVQSATNAAANQVAARGVSEVVGRRIVGALACAAVAGTDAGLYRVADMATDLVEVALGLEEDFDVIQELRETAVTVAGAAVIGGLGYVASDIVRSSAAYQSIFNRPYTPDYFANAYNDAVSRQNAIEIGISFPENWTDEQIAQAMEKIDAMNQTDMVKTPSVRDPNASASQRYREVYGADSVPAGCDVDHVQELQLGGADDVSNMRPIDRSVNRSFGTQINQALSDYPYGTRVSRIYAA